jgi:hypothetical protein
MDVQPDYSLQSVFQAVLTLQCLLEQLTTIEETLTEISDFIEDQHLPQPAEVINNMLVEVGQLKVHLRFCWLPSCSTHAAKYSGTSSSMVVFPCWTSTSVD